MIDGVTLGTGNALGVHPEGKSFDDCYTLLKRIGSGSFGEVYTAELKDKSVDKSQYACKVIDRTKLKPESDVTVFRELAILRDIRDLDNVTRLKDCFVTKEQVHVVQTLCRGGDVFEQLSKQKTYTEHDARDLAKTLFSVMELLHLRRLAHRDLKPENLLLVSRMQASQVVVADFGMAQYVPKGDGFLTTRCGTPAFVAPEVIAGRHYNTQVDMWSIGTLLFMLLGGKPPFADTSFQGLFRKIQAADYDFSAPQWKQVSIPAKQCLASLLRVDPYYRATASEALQSDWFKTSVDQLKGNDLTGSVRELKSWVAKRRFKSAVHAVRLTSHFSRFVVKDHSSLLQKVKAWDTDDNGNNNSSNQNGSGGSKSGTPLLAQWQGKTQNFEELYTIEQEIAKGVHSVVYKCTRKKPTSGKKLGSDGNPAFFAVKMTPRNKDKDVEQAVLHEVAVMQNLKHPAMVQIVDFIEDNNNYYVVLEHVPGVSVMEHLMRMQLRQKKAVSFTEHDARAIVEPLLEVIAYIHREGVVHRDISLDNLLMVDAEFKKREESKSEIDKKYAPMVKLCDFGLARRVPAPRSVTRCCGQPLYMAPEVVKHIPYDQSADMWSCGVLLYMLLCGTPPFAAATEKELFAKIRLGKWSFPPHIVNNGAISEAAEELVRKLLVPEPLQRWTAEEALRCKWFKEDESSLSSIDLSSNVPKLKDLKSKFKSVAKVVMKLTPTTSSDHRRPSIRNSDGIVMDADGIMMGKEVDLETFRATTSMFFTEDPEQKSDDPAKAQKALGNNELGLPNSQTESAKHIV